MKKLFLTSANEIEERTGSPAGHVSIGGNSIFYEVAGEGPPIVFIHDGLLHRRGWDAQFEFFAQEFTVVRYDRPGYGDSKPPLVEYSQVGTLHSLFEFLGIEQALLVGLEIALVAAQQARNVQTVLGNRVAQVFKGGVQALCLVK